VSPRCRGRAGRAHPRDAPGRAVLPAAWWYWTRQRGWSCLQPLLTTHRSAQQAPAVSGLGKAGPCRERSRAAAARRASARGVGACSAPGCSPRSGPGSTRRRLWRPAPPGPAAGCAPRALTLLYCHADITAVKAGQRVQTSEGFPPECLLSIWHQPAQLPRTSKVVGKAERAACP
jgi:hypothetical protein